MELKFAYLTAPGVFHDKSDAGGQDFVEYYINCDIQL